VQLHIYIISAKNGQIVVIKIKSSDRNSIDKYIYFEILYK